MFDWYQKYNGLRHTLALILQNEVADERYCLSPSHEDVINNEIKFPPKNQCRVLIPGCGNSSLGQDMLRDGWSGGITNVDYSSVVISQMNHRYNEDFYRKIQAALNREGRAKRKENDQLSSMKKPHDITKTSNSQENHVLPLTKMKFKFGDVTKKLEFADSSFDLIINKGLLDSILCSNGSHAKCRSMMQECSRLLNNRYGAMVIISHGEPDDRLHFLQTVEWTGGIWHFQIRKPKVMAQGEPG